MGKVTKTWAQLQATVRLLKLVCLVCFSLKLFSVLLCLGEVKALGAETPLTSLKLNLLIDLTGDQECSSFKGLVEPSLFQESEVQVPHLVLLVLPLSSYTCRPGLAWFLSLLQASWYFLCSLLVLKWM